MPGIPSGYKQLQLAKLDRLGSTDRGDKIPMNGVVGTLIDMAVCIISTAQNNLDKGGHEATGELESSIKARDIEIDGSKVYLDIELLDRYKFMDDGVKGVEGGTGKYRFKTIRPSVGMKNAIKSWLRLRGKRSTKYKPISKTERRDKGIARTRKKADSQEALAWAVATSIKKHGIKPTHFFSNAVKGCTRQFKQQIAAGFKIDIINSIK